MLFIDYYTNIIRKYIILNIVFIIYIIKIINNNIFYNNL